MISSRQCEFFQIFTYFLYSSEVITSRHLEFMAESIHNFLKKEIQIYRRAFAVLLFDKKYTSFPQSFFFQQENGVCRLLWGKIPSVSTRVGGDWLVCAVSPLQNFSNGFLESCTFLSRLQWRLNTFENNSRWTAGFNLTLSVFSHKLQTALHLLYSFPI